MSAEISILPTSDLLRQFAFILDELKRRGVVRSMNNPVGDLAERMVAVALDGQIAPASEKDYDVTVGQGDAVIRYQVKARRLHRDNASRQLSALRGMDRKSFDYLVGVLFAQDFTPVRAAIIPWELVRELATYRKHTNSWVFLLRDEIWGRAGVRDLALPVP